MPEPVPPTSPDSGPGRPAFLGIHTGSFSTPAAGNPTVVMVEAAYRHHGLDARYLNCEVAPGGLADAVAGARAMGWAGFNCSLPHKVTVIDHLDGLAPSAEVIGAVMFRPAPELIVTSPVVLVTSSATTTDASPVRLTLPPVTPLSAVTLTAPFCDVITAAAPAEMAALMSTLPLAVSETLPV